MPSGIIRDIDLFFDTRAAYTKEELRKLFISLAQEMVNQVQLHPEIEPFLKKAPFGIENTHIIIYNYDSKGRNLQDPQISTADISEGIITYRTTDPEDHYRFKNRIKETYEEALQELQKDKNDIL